MNTSFWFGWFLKGQMEVSIFDRLMLLLEVMALLTLALVTLYLQNLWNKWRTRTKEEGR